MGEERRGHSGWVTTLIMWPVGTISPRSPLCRISHFFHCDSPSEFTLPNKVLISAKLSFHRNIQGLWLKSRLDKQKVSPLASHLFFFYNFSLSLSLSCPHLPAYTLYSFLASLYAQTESLLSQYPHTHTFGSTFLRIHRKVIFVIFAHSWWIQDLSCSTVCGRHCLILLFMMHHTFLIGDRSGLQAGQSGTHTLCP